MSAIRDHEILFRGGGAEVLRSARPWRYDRMDGGEDEAPTITRADAATCALAGDAGHVLRAAAAHRLRLAYLYGTSAPSLLFENARTNAWTRSAELNDAVWTKANCTIGANAVAAPDGTTTMDKIVEASDVAQSHRISRNAPTLADTTRQCVSGYVRGDYRDWGPDRSWFAVVTKDKAGTVRTSYLNGATGAVGTKDGGHDVVIRRESADIAGAAVYRWTVVYDSASGGTTPTVEFHLATADGTNSYNGNGTSGLYLWGLDFAVDKAIPGSHLATAGSAVTRADDAASWPIGFGPDDDLTLYGKLPRPWHADLTGDLQVYPNVCAVGAASAGTQGALELYFGKTTRVLIAEIRTPGIVSVSQAVPAGATLEFCAQFVSLMGAAKCRLDVGSGFGADSSSAGAMTGFLGQLLLLGEGSNAALFGGIERFLVLKNQHTLAECQAVTW